MAESGSKLAQLEQTLRTSTRAMSHFAHTVIWLALLIVLIPAFCREWRWRWVDPTLSPGDYLVSGPGILYLTGCGLILLAFAVLARQRRAILALFAALLMYLQLTTGLIGWDRVLLALATLSIPVVLLEAWRQNRSLFRALRADHVNRLGLFARSLILWSPLLGIILLGFYGNYLLLQTTEKLVYQTTPIDSYCELNLSGQVHLLPCSGLDGTLSAETVRELPPEPVLRAHVQAKYSIAVRELLREISEDQPPFDDLNNLQALGTHVEATLAPVRVMGIADTPEPLDVLLRKDAAYGRLANDLRNQQRKVSQARAAIRQLKQAQQSMGLFGLMFNAQIQAAEVGLRRLQQQHQRVERQLRARRDKLAGQAAASEQAQGHDPHLQLRQTLAARLGGASQDAYRLLRGAGAQAADGGLKQAMIKEIVQLADRREQHTLAQLAPFMREGAELPALYGALYTTPLCTTARTNPDVRDREGNPTTLNTAPFPCFSMTAQETFELQPLGLIRSTEMSIDRWQVEREAAITQQLRALAKGTYASAADVRSKAAELTDAIPDTIDLGRKTCDLVHPGNCLTNFVKGQAEGAYEEQKAGFDGGARNLVARTTGEAAESIDTQLTLLRSGLYASLDSSAGLLRSTLVRLQQAGRLLAMTLNVLLCLAIIKSFLYVLATRIFDSRSGYHIDLEADNPVQGRYTAAPAVQIPRTFQPALITRDVLDNQEINTALMPWPFAAPLTRILHGAYFLFNKGSHFAGGQEGISFSRANGHDVIDWEMQAGEEVVFHYRNFFGASENVQLKTTISLRLSTILLGRFVFHSARCENGAGRLLLTAAGAVRDPEKTDSTSLERLLAWNRHTRFRVASQGTLRSVLLDGYTIVRLREPGQPNGLIVVEAIRDSRSRMVGTLRFVRTLLLPF